jgi:uncharacterized protein (DUF736 family)
MPRDKSEVGAMWTKRNDKGEYFSVALDLDALAELTGGALRGKVDLNVYPIPFEKTNPRAPDYRVKFYPRSRGDDAPTRLPRQAAPPIDEDMGF